MSKVRHLFAVPSSGPVMLALPTAAVLVVVLATVSGVLGYSSIDEEWARQSLVGGRGGLADMTAQQIFLTNLGCALLLFSGVVTGGLGALVGVVLTSAYVGATASVGVVNTGVGALVQQVGFYAPLEFAALAVAAVAGLLPAVAGGIATAQPGDRRRGVTAYVGGLHVALRLLAAALLVLLVAAGVEALILERR